MKLIKYVALGLIVLATISTISAQTYNLANGETLTYNTIGTRLAYDAYDNASGAVGQAGGIGGIANLMTSGYNALRLVGGGGAGDHGWTAVVALTPAQVAAGTLLYTQTTGEPQAQVEWATGMSLVHGLPTYTGTFYESLTWVPPGHTSDIKVNPVHYQVNTLTTTTLTVNSNSPMTAWFRGETQSSSTIDPAIFPTVMTSPSATLIWTNNQLHLIYIAIGGATPYSVDPGSVDIIVPTPVGWAGDVAIINMVEQGPNTSDGWNDAAYYITATFNGGQPTGTLTPTNTRLLPSQPGTLTWGVTNG